MLVAVRFRFVALITSLVLVIAAAGPAWGQNIIAQYDFGLLSGETSTGKDLSGRSNPGPGGGNQGWEAYYSDPNVTAADAYLSDSIPPSNEDYIEFTGPAYVDVNGNMIPVLRFEPGNNSNNPSEAVTKDKYFAFTVTANAGLLNLSSLTFNAGKGGSRLDKGQRRSRIGASAVGCGRGCSPNRAGQPNAGGEKSPGGPTEYQSQHS